MIKLLEKINRPLSAGEIAKLLDDNQKKISRDIKKLIQYGELLFKEVDKDTALIKYNCKHRLKVYYII